MYATKAGNIRNLEGFLGVCDGGDCSARGPTVCRETVALSILAPARCSKYFSREESDGFLVVWVFLSSVASVKKIAKLFKLNVCLCLFWFGFLIHWYLFQMLWLQK